MLPAWLHRGPPSVGSKADPVKSSGPGRVQLSVIARSFRRALLPASQDLELYGGWTFPGGLAPCPAERPMRLLNEIVELSTSANTSLPTVLRNAQLTA